jgi:adenylate cyclase
MKASNPEEKAQAWLDAVPGGRVPIEGTCSIGRLASNQVVLANDHVSRHHALINAQGNNQFWLVDLGSDNGTFLNGRRMVQPTVLRDGDRIEIATFHLRFRQPGANPPACGPASETAISGRTLQEIKATDCWLLLADMENSTQALKSLPAATLPQVTGQWLSECRRLVEAHGGSVNKFLGDGLFAYWRHRAGSAGQVMGALESFGRMQALADPAFRVVLHLGRVVIGGAASLGEESLQGGEVNFVFRMEKLAAALGQHSLISGPARALLASRLRLTDAGRHAVPGFDGEYQFHTVAPFALPPDSATATPLGNINPAP